MSTPAAEGSPEALQPRRFFSAEEVEQFQRQGFLIARGLVSAEQRQTMVAATLAGLAGEVAPVEFEAELHYPGAPSSLQAEGGHTVRRLKQAQARHPVFSEWVTHPELVGRLQQLFGQRVVMPLGHHNCIMTKQPRFSSDTLWHQDIRYWSFQRPELISVWLALGDERPENGSLCVIPGTHVMSFSRERLDEALFLRPDLPENQVLIAQKVPVELAAGDVLFFHCRTFHAAGKNLTNQPKFSAVFTFRPADNPPVPGSRSAEFPELSMPEVSDWR
jgi:phytanoyl-CoA hydroxylase